MGKHKNATQNGIILDFMEKYPDLAKGFTKRDKPKVDALWLELAEALNGAGPPKYEANGWKKKWIEWKSEVKRKLAQNKAESRATGGGPYTKHQLTATEEAIVRLCGIAVEGVPGIALGVEDGDSIDEEMPSTSSKRTLPEVPRTNTPKRLRTETTGDYFKKFVDDERQSKSALNNKLEELIKIEKENARSLRRSYKANEAVAGAVVDLKNEFSRFSAGLLKCKQNKIELLQRQLDLETQKFDYEQSRLN